MNKRIENTSNVGKRNERSKKRTEIPNKRKKFIYNIMYIYSNIIEHIIGVQVRQRIKCIMEKRASVLYYHLHNFENGTQKFVMLHLQCLQHSFLHIMISLLFFFHIPFFVVHLMPFEQHFFVFCIFILNSLKSKVGYSYTFYTHTNSFLFNGSKSLVFIKKQM